VLIACNYTGTALPIYKGGNKMEVMKLAEATPQLMQQLVDDGSYTTTYTINGEKWLYIIHPVKGSVKTH
jgi:hypothetical protein